MNDNTPSDNVSNALLHAAAGAARMHRFVCSGCGASICTTPPINLLLVCTLCERVLEESPIG